MTNILSYAPFILNKKGVAAGKIGTAELIALSYFEKTVKVPFFAWEKKFKGLCYNAGFFPCKMEAIKKWKDEMHSAIARLDFILKWQRDPKLSNFEERIIHKLAPSCKVVNWESIGLPTISEIFKFRVLVISPFVKTMKQQIDKMDLIHPALISSQFAENFKNTQFLKCPLHWHLEKSPFNTWQEGLENLAEFANKMVFDIAIIGAGAWSLPLAARIKQTGRVAIHTGGETQLFFGIKGKRWDNYGFYNSSWISPLPEETPSGRQKIDDGCYW